MRIRKATPDDAAGIVAVLQAIVTERVYSAIEQAWTVEQERAWIASRSSREAFHVSVDDDGAIVGFQTLDEWAPGLTSMAHVGQIGTFVLPQFRGTGMGRALWSATEAFARAAGYRKMVIQVRASNTSAQAFYRRIGFRDCGRLSRQVIVHGVEDDEILMELFLEAAACP